MNNTILTTIAVCTILYALITNALTDTSKLSNCFDYQIENWGDLIGEMDTDTTVDYGIRLKYAVIECMEKP